MAITATARKAVAVVIGTPFQKCKAIYVGVGGDVNLTIDGTDVVFKGMVAGTEYAYEATNVKAASTTATDLVALY